MAWLFHPTDYAALESNLCQIKFPRAGLGAQEIAASTSVELGHIIDTDHPELGKPTFAEFGVLYANVMKEERRTFGELMKTLEGMSVPGPCCPLHTAEGSR